MCKSLNVAVNKCINWCFVHLFYLSADFVQSDLPLMHYNVMHVLMAMVKVPARMLKGMMHSNACYCFWPITTTVVVVVVVVLALVPGWWRGWCVWGYCAKACCCVEVLIFIWSCFVLTSQHDHSFRTLHNFCPLSWLWVGKWVVCLYAEGLIVGRCILERANPDSNHSWEEMYWRLAWHLRKCTG